jgi:hypothetical protein
LSHSIAVWRATIATPMGSVDLAPGRGVEELPEDGADAIAEIMRRYPELSRGIAEYLAR